MGHGDSRNGPLAATKAWVLARIASALAPYLEAANLKTAFEALTDVDAETVISRIGDFSDVDTPNNGGYTSLNTIIGLAVKSTIEGVAVSGYTSEYDAGAVALQEGSSVTDSVYGSAEIANKGFANAAAASAAASAYGDAVTYADSAASAAARPFQFQTNYLVPSSGPRYRYFVSPIAGTLNKIWVASNTVASGTGTCTIDVEKWNGSTWVSVLTAAKDMETYTPADSQSEASISGTTLAVSVGDRFRLVCTNSVSGWAAAYIDVCLEIQ